MKNLFILSTLFLFVISCNRNDSESETQNSYNGKWFVKTIEITEISSSGNSTSTQTLGECLSKTNFNISAQNVIYQEFSSCANYEQFNGSYNNSSKKLILHNYENQNSYNYDVEFFKDEMFLKHRETITYGNQTITYIYTLICKK
ncbi:hypothetical protein G6R40_02215 [Chryseobacterium sp. POL2]|uniref:hypothetical protein n=1 Tax=Chryseobacterium sp. POL2 TaxID=2713414 RepID=UPI0013E13F96|nr:hypothetical protein [Chryseobacterium sp. POL2]QIG88547.1 hypothetical protein G6R40_02215 [Chryseobacterium sp. POL2]